VLGDNIFYGHDFAGACCAPRRRSDTGATVFAYPCTTPSATAWSSSTRQGAPSASKKSPAPKSRYAVTGLYFYDEQVVRHRRGIKPSPRGELEITDVNRALPGARAARRADHGPRLRLARHRHPRRLLEASQFIQTLEKRQGLKVACPEEIAWRKGWIDAASWSAGQPLAKNGYGQYLLRMLDETRCSDEPDMKVIPPRLPEVLILEPKVFGDERGFFMESFNQRAFRPGATGRTCLRAGQPLAARPGACCAACTTRSSSPGQAGAGGQPARLRRGGGHAPLADASASWAASS
jgi:hypothetical protein